MDGRSVRAAPWPAFLVALLAATLLAGVACSGSPKPPPSTTGPTTSTPTTSAPPTAEHRRCVDEAAFLILRGNVLVHIAATYTNDTSSGAREQNVADAQQQLALLRARLPREPYATDRQTLITAATNIIAGIQGLLGRGDHKSDREDDIQVTKGGSEAIGALSSIREHRSTCPP